MTKVKPNNGNEIKWDIFLWGRFKSDTISFFIKKYYNISMPFKIKISQYYEYGESKPWEWNKIRHFSMGHVQIWQRIFFYQKVLKYFNDFQNRDFSVLWLKWTKTMEMKQSQTFFRETYSNLTPFFIKTC